MIVKNICILTFFFCISIVAIFAQSGENVEIINAVTMESFDSVDAGWSVRGSRFIDGQFLDSRIVEAWPNQLFGNNPPETLRALGVRGAFTNRGHNFIEILPPGDGINLPGIVKELELWVWNAARNYYVTAELQDYRGVYHTIELGDINYLGWGRLSVRIPNSVLQTEKRNANVDQLRLIKLVLWTDPTENVDDFQVYFDELRVLSDTFQKRVDGEELADPEFIDRIWG